MRLSLPLLFSLLLLSSVSGYRSSPHYGAGRRVPLSSLRTLTFYAGQKTAYRRTNPLPQLRCVGKPCRRFEPDVVQCTSMGDGQWQCQADLPPSIRMGRVEVSCEGYEHADDEFVLKDSCALEYHLLPAYGPDEEARYGYRKQDDSMPLLFQLVFWGITLFIVYSFIRSFFDSRRAANAHSGGTGSWPGGGGGFWPGGGGAPPPPYSKDDPSSGSSTGWRPGFWTGLGLGSVAANLYNNRQQQNDARYRGTMFNSNPWERDSFRGGRRFDDDSGPSSFRPSTGFGGTRNR